jgi:hypothetical protein
MLFLIRASDCEDDSTEGAALNQVTQTISRFGQREGLSHLFGYASDQLAKALPKRQPTRASA